jgi:hypothetical protein
MRFLEVFCGRGGWSKQFASEGWECFGIDIVDSGYPFELWLQDARKLSHEEIDSFDAVIFSPPCDDFARAWMPWLRFDKTPSNEALELLKFSIALCDRPRRLTECSKFARRHIDGSVLFGSYALWGDVPPLRPQVCACKERRSGLRPDLRAEIPPELATWIARCFTRQMQAVT